MRPNILNIKYLVNHVYMSQLTTHQIKESVHPKRSVSVTSLLLSFGSATCTDLVACIHGDARSLIKFSTMYVIYAQHAGMCEKLKGTL